MKRFIIMMVAAILASGLAIAQSNKANDPQLEQEFTKIYQAWDDALVKVDLKALGLLYADEYSSIGPDGIPHSKEELLASFKSRKDVVSSASTDQMKIAKHGETVVVSSRWTAKEINEGKDISGQSRWTDVWVKRDGRWQAVATHGSDTTDTDDEAKRKITQLYKDWDTALVRNDLDALGRIMGDDFVGTDPDGAIDSKATVLADLKSGKVSISAAATDELKITVYQNTAVVTGRLTANGKAKGVEWSGSFRLTDTLIRRNGNWQVVADHVSKVTAK